MSKRDTLNVRRHETHSHRKETHTHIHTHMERTTKHLRITFCLRIKDKRKKEVMSKEEALTSRFSSCREGTFWSARARLNLATLG